MKLRIGSVFSGIGGLDLGVAWTGLGDIVYQVELDAYARRVLRTHASPSRASFESSILDDVRLCGRGRAHGPLPYADILIGGSPCQGFSQSGDRKGFDDPRSALWFEMRRLIEEGRPLAVLFENVIELTRSVKGEPPAIDTIVSDLRALGYATWVPFVLSSHDILDASGVRAPQRRCRVFVTAVIPGVLNKLAVPVPDLQPPPPFFWPTRPGIPPLLSEPRRVIPKATRYPGTHKRIRLHALGNAVMPPMGYVAARILRARLLGEPTNVSGFDFDFFARGPAALAPPTPPTQRSIDKNDWPTPVTTDCKGARRSTARTDAWTSNPGTTLTDAVWLADTRDYGSPLNPAWVEMLMGFPPEWTFAPDSVPADTLTTGPAP